MNSGFKWNKYKAAAALELAQGFTQIEVAANQGVTDRTVRNWLAEPEFKAEVDRLSLMIGIASRAERLRIAQRVMRQRTCNLLVETDKDLLEWLKFAQSETDGIKLNLAETFLKAATSMAGSGPTGTVEKDREQP